MPKLPVQTPITPSFAGISAQSPAVAKAKPFDRKRLLQLLQIGMDLQRQGKFLEAERYYQTVLAQAPDMPEANNLMGTIAIEAEDFAVAVEFFEKAVKGLPKDTLIRHNIASALISLNDYHDAIPHLRRALDLKPGQVETVALVATCYNLMGRGKEALQFAAKSLGMDDLNQKGRVAYAAALINLGRMDEAEPFVKATIAKRIAVPHSYQSLSSIRKFSAASPELVAVKAEIENPEYSEKERALLFIRGCEDE